LYGVRELARVGSPGKYNMLLKAEKSIATFHKVGKTGHYEIWIVIEACIAQQDLQSVQLRVEIETMRLNFRLSFEAMIKPSENPFIHGLCQRPLEWSYVIP
jgi:hypothetical protein